jgi:hypothetical protein
MSALYAVQVAIYDRLMATPAFTTLATGGVWNGQAPAGTVGKYVVITPSGEDDARYFGQPGYNTPITVDCWDVPVDGVAITHYLGASQLYAALKAALAPEAGDAEPLAVDGMADDVMVSVRMVLATLDDTVAATAARIQAEVTVFTTVAT